MKKDFSKKALQVLFGTTISFSTVYAGAMGPVNSAHNWTGFYLGGNAGVMWSTFSGPVTIETLNSGLVATGPSVLDYNKRFNGTVTGGAQLGYNYQATNHWVLGAEFQFNGERINNIHYVTASELTASNTMFVADDSYGIANAWHSSFLARLGYSWGQWLVYATGGVSLANERMSGYFASTTRAATFYPEADGSDNQIVAGGTVGGGLGFGLAPNIQLLVEGRYTDYGKQKFNLAQQIPVISPSAGVFLYAPSYSYLNSSSEEVLVKINYQFT